MQEGVGEGGRSVMLGLFEASLGGRGMVWWTVIVGDSGDSEEDCVVWGSRQVLVE